MARILIVEDDAAMADMLSNYLSFDQHSVETTDNGEDGLYLIESNSFDLAIIDWRLPKLNGVELCKRFRANGGTTMILMLTGRDSVAEKAQGLDAGADDYLTKPFHIDELTARVRALLRRLSGYSADNSLRAGNVKLNLTQHTVSVNEKSLDLIPKEFAILEMLMRYPGRVFTIDEIIMRVWKNEDAGSADAVRTHIKNIRKKISNVNESDPIETVHGIGYKFSAKS
ncbi:MAG TPA: response regulator transcription factor [Candidatus Obscuribacterales bacterium]